MQASVRFGGFSSFKNSIRNFLQGKQSDFEDRADALCDFMEDWMKANARWQDRTGKARESLSADYSKTSLGAIRVVLYYDYDVIIQGDPRGKDYSKYLEGYLGLAILPSAIDHVGSVWRDFMVE